MRYSKKKIKKFLRGRKFKIIRKLLTIIVFYIICAICYHYLEGWNILDCVYFITVVCGRLFTIVFITIGWLYIFSIITEAVENSLRVAEKQLKTAEKTTIATTASIKPTKSSFAMRKYASLGIIFLWAAVGTLYMKFAEGKSVVTAMYWSIVTIASVGFGDISQTQDSFKIFAIFYLLLSVILITYSIARYELIQQEEKNERKKLKILGKRLDFAWIEKLDWRGKGVTEFDFVVGILTQLEVLDKETHILPWVKRFHELDVDKNGVLDYQDMINFAREEEKHILQEEKSPEMHSSDSKIKLDRILSMSGIPSFSFSNESSKQNDLIYDHKNSSSSSSSSSEDENEDETVEKKTHSPTRITADMLELRSSKSSSYSTSQTSKSFHHRSTGDQNPHIYRINNSYRNSALDNNSPRSLDDNRMRKNRDFSFNSAKARFALLRISTRDDAPSVEIPPSHASNDGVMKEETHETICI